MPPLLLNGLTLEPVHSYKYLGIEINDQLKWENQWHLVQRKTSTIPYLIKRLKHLGFRQEIMVSVYRSHALSHFTYSAPLLTDLSSKTKAEIEHFQKRILRILNISQQDILDKFKIPKIDQFIDEACTKILKRITQDPAHPLTRKLASSNNRKGKLTCKASFTKSSHYTNSFVQKYLRTIENGATDLYASDRLNIQYSIHTKRTIPQARLDPPSPICTNKVERIATEKNASRMHIMW